MPKINTLPPRVPVAQQRVPTIQPGSWRAGRTSSTARGYGYRWQRAREAFLAEHPLCVMCQAEGRVEPATVVDHVVPHRGDERLFWDRGNWQSLCARCHSGAKQRMEEAV